MSPAGLGLLHGAKRHQWREAPSMRWYGPRSGARASRRSNGCICRRATHEPLTRPAASDGSERLRRPSRMRWKIHRSRVSTTSARNTWRAGRAPMPEPLAATVVGATFNELQPGLIEKSIHRRIGPPRCRRFCGVPAILPPEFAFQRDGTAESISERGRTGLRGHAGVRTRCPVSVERFGPRYGPHR